MIRRKVVWRSAWKAAIAASARRPGGPTVPAVPGCHRNSAGPRRGPEQGAPGRTPRARPRRTAATRAHRRAAAASRPPGCLPGQSQPRRTLIGEQGIDGVTDRESDAFQRAPQQRRSVIGQRQRRPGAAQGRIGIRCPFPDRCGRRSGRWPGPADRHWRRAPPGGVHDLPDPVKAEPPLRLAPMWYQPSGSRPVEVDPGSAG